MEKTPGRAAYEARQVAKGRRMGADDSTPDSGILAVIALGWDELPAGMQADEEAGAHPAQVPRQAIPVAELTEAELTAAVVGAAQAYDYENRPRDRNWTAVPFDQVARIVTGALGAMEFEPAPGGQWTEAELAAALDSFYAWFTVVGGGARVQGQLLGADVDEFARALHAQLDANRAHQEKGSPAR